MQCCPDLGWSGKRSGLRERSAASGPAAFAQVSATSAAGSEWRTGVGAHPGADPPAGFDVGGADEDGGVERAGTVTVPADQGEHAAVVGASLRPAAGDRLGGALQRASWREFLPWGASSPSLLGLGHLVRRVSGCSLPAVRPRLTATEFLDFPDDDLLPAASSDRWAPSWCCPMRGIAQPDDGMSRGPCGGH